MKKLLLLMLITPLIGFGQYIFNTKADLQTAVDLYIEDKNNAIITYGDINTWDVSNITDMSSLFENKTFNENISNWNTSNVTNMGGMFSGANSFNQPIGDWDVSNVTNMTGMFAGADSFNQPIGDWDVSSVTSMFLMLDAESFNQPIGDWDVSNVTNMAGMFNYAYSFNQLIGDWDVSNVTNMAVMFKNAISFNRDISNWCVTNISSEPNDFSTSSPLIEENKPVWGTCPISVSAGDDLNVCDDEVVQMTGASASNYVSLYWSSNGDGSFVNTSSLNPTYYPGSNDISNGNVILTLIAVNSNNEQVQDAMIVNISQSPCGENRKINLNGPVYITEADGLILKSAENGKCYRLKIIAESLLLEEVNCE